MKANVFISYLYLSTALCTVVSPTHAMKEEELDIYENEQPVNLFPPQPNFFEISENREKKKIKEKKSPSLTGLISCPPLLDEGLQTLQERLTQKIAGGKNTLKGLKKKLNHIVQSLEKGDLQKNLEEFVSLLSFPEELILNSEKGDLALTLGEYYFQNQKDTKTVLTHPAFKALDQRIERCEYFADLLDSSFKEGSLALREIKVLYETYKQGFLQFNPHTMKENYKHHLAPQAELYGTLLSPHLIQQSLAYELVSRTLLGHLDKQNKEGTHAVRSFGGMHFKVYDYDSEMGLCPGKEMAMYHLYQLLIGEGVAPSTLICLGELPFVDLEKTGIKGQINTAIQKGENIIHLLPQVEHKLEVHKTKSLYPIQVSSTVEGIGFHTFLQNHFFAEWIKKNPNNDPQDYVLQDHEGNGFRLGFQQRFAYFILPKRIGEQGRRQVKETKWHTFFETFNPDEWSLDHIDEDSFARMTLMSFLTDPGDSKADNFMLMRKENKWHLVSIDTDRVFEPNLQKIVHGKKGNHKVHHKSIFYTLPAFMKNKSLSTAVKNQFKNINAPLALAKWLLTLSTENKAYGILKEESSLPEKTTTKMKLPTTFKKGQISTLLNRIESLQKIFTHHAFNLTLDRTFQLMHPILHAYYEKLQAQYPDDPLTMIYADNTRQNNQELTLEDVLKESLNDRDEEGQSFAKILEGYSETDEESQETTQTIEECLEELGQLVKQTKDNKPSLTLLDLILDAKDTDLFKRMINAQGPQAVNATFARKFYQRTLKKDSMDPELKKAWDFLVNHTDNAKLHWYMELENLFLTPGEAKTYQETHKKNVFKITGASEGDLYLSQEIWNQLINEKNEFKRQNQDGAHVVGKAVYNGYTLYFKFLPKLPGLEEAVGRWTRNLIGFGAPHVELFRLKDFPILVSQEIKGLTLKETIQKYPERLKQLDKKSLSQVLFTTMLINPEDGKPDNIIVEQISQNLPLYRLIGVDNDQAFVPTSSKTGKTAQVKSILYCFDEMDTLIDEETRELFKDLDPHVLISTWLNELDLVHGRQENLFTNTKDNNALLKKLFQEHDSYVGVPFRRGDLHDFYDRFLRLQSALHDVEVKTYHDLLMRIEPRLGKRYGALRQDSKSPKDLYERFKKIDGKFFSRTMGTLTSGKDTLGAKGISEKEVIDDIIKKDRHYTPKLALKELERRVNEVAKMEISGLFQAQDSNIEAFASEEFRIKFFKDLDFNHILLDKEKKNYGPVSIESQKMLLNGLIPYDLHELTLNNCQALTLPMLKTFRLQDLTHVTLTGCAGVTSQVVTYFSEQCLGLVYLDLSRSPNLSYLAVRTLFSYPLSFTNLKKLMVNQCTKLNEINIQGGQLYLVDAQENPNLLKLEIQSKSLKALNVSKNPKIMDKTLDELEKICPNLETIVCEDCSLRWFTKFRQNFPFSLQRKLEKESLQKIKEVYEQKLTSLNLWSNNIGPEGAKALASNATLTKLSLGGNKIDDEGAMALSLNTILTELDLSTNNIGGEGAKALANNTTLTALDLSANNIDDEGAKALANNTTLTALDLSENKIGDEGAMAVSQSTTFISLCLSVNSIGDEGAKALANNTTLTSLDLWSNNIGSEGVKALTQNTTLKLLNLWSNKIGDEGATAFKQKATAFKQNTTLKLLDLWSTMSKETFTLIKEILEPNKKRKEEKEKNNNNSEDK